jgi:hypothetical protein
MARSKRKPQVDRAPRDLADYSTRNSRSLSLTEPGKLHFERSESVLEEVQEPSSNSALWAAFYALLFESVDRRPQV